jgi:hypothetical protein
MTWPGGIRVTASSTSSAYGLGRPPTLTRVARPAETLSGGWVRDVIRPS